MCLEISEFATKVLEDLLSGSILLVIGFEFFKEQQKFIALVQEIQKIAENLDEFLKRYKELSGKLLKFENEILWNYQKRISEFLTVFVARKGISNTVFLEIEKTQIGIDESVPENLRYALPLQPHISFLRHHAVSSAVARNVVWQSLSKFNAGDPGVGEQEVSNILNEYQKERAIFFKHLDFLETIVHKARHGYFDWKKFCEELKSYQMN